MRITNGEIGLNVTVDGPDDAPPVLLLHGILSSGATWEWLVPDLTPGHRVLRLDFRGHGDSDRAPGSYALPGYLSDAVAVCEQLARAPVAVIGHSLGGATAAALAQTRPELVRGALLEDAPLGLLEREPTDDRPANALFTTFALIRQMLPGVQAAGTSVEDFTAVMSVSPSSSGRPLGEVLHPDGLVTMSKGMLAVDPTVLDPVLEGRQEPVARSTQAFEVPVTVVAADPAFPDAVTQPSDLEAVSASTPSARTATITGAGHLIHDSRGGRESFREIVLEFLAAL